MLQRILSLPTPPLLNLDAHTSVVRCMGQTAALFKLQCQTKPSLLSKISATERLADRITTHTTQHSLNNQLEMLLTCVILKSVRCLATSV